MRAKYRVAVVVSAMLLAMLLAPLSCNAGGVLADGARDYRQYCAVCHGAIGRGDGPMAEKLIRRPSDLTVLSKNNGGSFPETVIYQIVDGRRIVQFHGSTQMPIWGERFGGSTGEEQAVDARISGLLKYMESIQSR